jgi:hypothetical protein
MALDLTAALKPVLERLQALASTDAELRAQLRQLGQTLLAFANDPTSTKPNVDLSPAADQCRVPPVPPVTVLPQPATYPFREAVSENARLVDPTELASAWKPIGLSDEELPELAARFRLKAEGTRWAGLRQRMMKGKCDFVREIEPRDREMLERGKALTGCSLWMCTRSAPVPTDLARYDHLAGCFEAGASIAALLAEMSETSVREEEFEQALRLAAETQSALRVAVTGIGADSDSDQQKLFRWVRATAGKHQVWIERYMRQEDPADPSRWPELLERARQIEDILQSLRNRDKRRRKLFSKVRYLSRRLGEESKADRGDDWSNLFDAVEELVQDSLPPSNSELRDLLLPVLDHIPDTLEPPRGFQLAVREIDRYLASRADLTAETIAEVPTDSVRRAADLLRGRTLVLIGGVRRPESAEALEQALSLKELLWLEGREHSSYYTFEPEIARPDVVAVLLAIRWSSHGFGEVKDFCDRYGKPLVRLPGGYNPNQVAHQILIQIGERLAEQAGRVAG